MTSLNQQFPLYSWFVDLPATVALRVGTGSVQTLTVPERRARAMTAHDSLWIVLADAVATHSSGVLFRFSYSFTGKFPRVAFFFEHDSALTVLVTGMGAWGIENGTYTVGQTYYVEHPPGIFAPPSVKQVDVETRHLISRAESAYVLANTLVHTASRTYGTDMHTFVRRRYVSPYYAALPAFAYAAGTSPDNTRGTLAEMLTAWLQRPRDVVAGETPGFLFRHAEAEDDEGTPIDLVVSGEDIGTSQFANVSSAGGSHVDIVLTWEAIA